MCFDDDQDDIKQAAAASGKASGSETSLAASFRCKTTKADTDSETESGGRAKGLSLSKSNVKKRGPKKAASRMKKSPEAPKRFKSAYIFFSTDKHKEIRAQLGESGLSEKTTNISKMVSEAWRDLTPEERGKWEILARNDRTRYDSEKATFNGAWHVPKGREKSSNAPKRPMSAFLAFANSRRGIVKRGMPGASNGDVSRALAAMWKDASDDVRQNYFDEEYKKRQLYKTAMVEWKNQDEEEKRARKQKAEMAASLTEAIISKSEFLSGETNQFVDRPLIESQSLACEMVPSPNAPLPNLNLTFSSRDLRGIPGNHIDALSIGGTSGDATYQGPRLFNTINGDHHSLASLLAFSRVRHDITPRPLYGLQPLERLRPHAYIGIDPPQYSYPSSVAPPLRLSIDSPIDLWGRVQNIPDTRTPTSNIVRSLLANQYQASLIHPESLSILPWSRYQRQPTMEYALYPAQGHSNANAHLYDSRTNENFSPGTR